MAISWGESAGICRHAKNKIESAGSSPARRRTTAGSAYPPRPTKTDPRRPKVHRTAVHVAAGLAVMTWWLVDTPSPNQLTGAALLTLGSLAAVTLHRHTDIDALDLQHSELQTVATLASGLLYGPAAASATATVLYAAVRTRTPGKTRLRPLRETTTGFATSVLASGMAAAVFHQAAGTDHTYGSLPPTWSTAFGALSAVAVNITLIRIAAYGLRTQSRPHQGARRSSRHSSGLAADISTAAMAICVAALLTVHPVLLAATTAALLPIVHEARLAAYYRDRSELDAKTGIMNATRWRELAQRELHRACRHAQPLSLAVIDLDHFKQVNDTHGHLAGDQVLKAIAGVLLTHAREYDLVGRFGGEEFVILLPATSSETAAAAAERHRRAIADLHTEICDQAHRAPATAISVTASIGIATWEPGTEQRTLDDLLNNADRASYEAKDRGRNQVRRWLGG